MRRKLNDDDMTCCFPKCGSDSTVLWLEHPLCTKHWNWVCDNGNEKAYRKLKTPQDKIKINVPDSKIKSGKSLLDKLKGEK